MYPLNCPKRLSHAFFFHIYKRLLVYNCTRSCLHGVFYISTWRLLCSFALAVSVFRFMNLHSRSYRAPEQPTERPSLLRIQNHNRKWHHQYQRKLFLLPYVFWSLSHPHIARTSTLYPRLSFDGNVPWLAWKILHIRLNEVFAIAHWWN